MNKKGAISAGLVILLLAGGLMLAQTVKEGKKMDKELNEFEEKLEGYK